MKNIKIRLKYCIFLDESIIIDFDFIVFITISLRVLHSSTKHSSICSGGKNGNPTNSDNHFPISHVFSLHGYVKMEIMCHCYMYCYREKVKYVIPTDVVFNISAL
jgi:hypothetical protein